MKWKKIPWMLLMMGMFVFTALQLPVYAEEETEETEYIPEAYYDPIQTNEISGWPQGEAVQSGAAVVMDLNTNTFLYSKNAEEKCYPASITKIMTAMVALENGNLQDEITFSEAVYDLEEGSSHVGIQPGEKMTLEQALYALMLESANDAGMGIAEHIAGSVDAFAQMMNEKAEALGCINTHFTNPHGLHNEEHYTCARDMAVIAQAAYEIPEFRKMVSCTLETCPETNMTEEARYFVNHHKMLHEESEYYADWCTGGKTGYTSDAWNTLVTYGEKNGRRQVCVVLRVPGSAKTYEETRLLMNYGFDNFSQINMVSDQPMPTFYEAMKLNYLGLAKKYFQSDLLNETIGKTMSGVVTLPNNASVKELSAATEDTSQTIKSLKYSYHNWPVGMAVIELHPMPAGIVLPFEQELDVETLLQHTSKIRAKNEIEATALIVYEKAEEMIREVYTAAAAFTEENKMVMLLGGAFLLLVVLILISIWLARCTREFRIQKRRRQEEKVRLRRAEELDQMTTAEIEQELREAMAQERQRRAQEEAQLEEKRRQEEAEREEERRREEELRETERLLEEINNSKQNEG